MNITLEGSKQKIFVPEFTFSASLITDARYDNPLDETNNFSLQEPPILNSSLAGSLKIESITEFINGNFITRLSRNIMVPTSDQIFSGFTSGNIPKSYVYTPENLLVNTENTQNFDKFEKGKTYYLSAPNNCTITIDGCNKLYTGPLLRLTSPKNCNSFTPTSKGQYSIEECTNKYVFNISTFRFNRCNIEKNSDDTGYKCGEQTNNRVTINNDIACAEKPENFIPICIIPGTGKLNTNESLNKVVVAATGDAGPCSSITNENDCVNSYEESTMKRCKYVSGQCTADSNTVSDISNFKGVDIYCSENPHIISTPVVSNLCPAGTGKKDNSKLTFAETCESKNLSECSDFYSTNTSDSKTYRCRTQYLINDFSPISGSNWNTYKIRFKPGSNKKQIEIQFKNGDSWVNFRTSPFSYDTSQMSTLNRYITDADFTYIYTLYVPDTYTNNAGNLGLIKYGVDDNVRNTGTNIFPPYYLNNKTYECSLSNNEVTEDNCSTKKVFLNHKELSDAINVKFNHIEGGYKDNNGDPIIDTDVTNKQNNINLKYGDSPSKWDTSYVINGTGLFEEKIINTDISAFDTVNMKYASNMFKNSKIDVDLDLEHWLTNQITCFDFDKNMTNPTSKKFIIPPNINSNCGYN